MKVGIISGSGFYDFPEVENRREIKVYTDFGDVSIIEGKIEDKEIFYINRHGSGHTILPHQINHRANILAFREIEVDCIIATTVTGVVQPDIELGRLLVFEDLYFPENRLPGGEPCTIFASIGQKDRGHLIWDSPFSQSLRYSVIKSVKNLGEIYYDKVVYGYVNGPRFNTKAEISVLRQIGVSAVSQTAGPEAILSAELEIPYQLIGFGTDYANGVKALPTPIEELNANMKSSNVLFKKVILEAVRNLKTISFDQGFVYRFE